MSTTPGSTQKTLDEIDVLVRSRYPVLYLLTHEEARVELLIAQMASRQKKPLFAWTATQGLIRCSEHPEGPSSSKGKVMDPCEILSHIQTDSQTAIYLLKDFHPFLDDPHVVRRLRDAATSIKDSYKTILICSPRLNLPVELEKEVTIVDFPLPDVNELFDLLKSVCETLMKQNKSTVNLNNGEAAAIVRAAQGLTLSEAENVFAKAVVQDSVIDRRDIELVLREKQQLIRKSGILEFYPFEGSLKEIGGLENLKNWLLLRGKAFTAAATDFGLSPPKGVLLLGAPGCGKSLTAKAVANAWRFPLLRLDFGKIFSGLVGSSEENMRRALKVAESVSPAVLWIDEIEKALSGGTQGNSDGGTAARVFGTFLTWMQEKTAKVFVIATANRIDALPPELLRRGRFDEIFFADLPGLEARQEIFSIHLRKKKRSPETFDLKQLSQVTAGFSGAEIEHCLMEALFSAYGQNRELKIEDLLKAIQETIPLSITYAEELKRLREWAVNRARPADEALTNPEGSLATRGARLELKR